MHVARDQPMRSHLLGHVATWYVPREGFACLGLDLFLTGTELYLQAEGATTQATILAFVASTDLGLHCERLY